MYNIRLWAITHASERPSQGPTPQHHYISWSYPMDSGQRVLSLQTPGKNEGLHLMYLKP